MFRTMHYEADAGGGSGGAPAPAPATTEPAASDDHRSTSDDNGSTITAREAELTKRENTLAAKEALANAKLPAGFIDIVVQDDLDAQKAIIDKIAKLWNTELKEAVKARLAGEVPTSAGSDSRKFSELTYQEKLALKRSSPDAYAALMAQA